MMQIRKNGVSQEGTEHCEMMRTVNEFFKYSSFALFMAKNKAVFHVNFTICGMN